VKSTIGKKRGYEIFDIAVLIILTLWALVILYPVYNTILVSVVSEAEYQRASVLLFPEKLDFLSYRMVFANDKIINGFKVTLIVTIAGLAYNMFLTVTAAYALSRSDYPGKKMFNYIVVFTMYFSGGLIPTYLLTVGLGLGNKLSAMILPYGINVFYMLVIKNYFSNITPSLEESARIEGANDIYILWKIILPVSKPVIATFVLFYAVDRWNEWYNGLLYMRSIAKWPLQLVLRQMLASIEMADRSDIPMSVKTDVFSDGVRMAAVVVTAFPIMCFYPFLQKHFIKGIMIGSVKG
jgi:putative aldouronate transport system permease protein